MEQINITELIKKARQDRDYNSWDDSREVSFDFCLQTSLLHILGPVIDKDKIIKNKAGDHILDVDLTINGVSVSFTKLIKWWYDLLDQEIEEKLADLIPDKIRHTVRHTVDLMTEFIEEIEDRTANFRDSFSNSLAKILSEVDRDSSPEETKD